jgi:short-subunit dehydrogenase
MKLKDRNIILTGAAGGIGRPLALALARKGARLALVERDEDRLLALCGEVIRQGGTAMPVHVELGTLEAAEAVVAQSHAVLGSVDVLVNNAGLLDFVPFEQHDPARIELLVNTNVTVPMLLARAVLPHLLAQGSGRIVNVGSALGAIGMAYHAAYCGSKFALRGFSEALRRELADTGVGVTYVAPRATRTALNNDRATSMLVATGTAMDEPANVAREIVQAIEADVSEYAIGQPEKFFARLNGLLPRLVDRGLRKQTRIARQFT